MPKTLDLLEQLQEELEEALPKEKAQRVKKLIAQISEEIAEATFKVQSFEIKKEIKEDLKNELASKEDIEDLKEKVLQIELKVERNLTALEQTKVELIKWIVGLFLAQTTFLTGLMFAIIKLFLTK